VDQLRRLGHSVDKVEFILMGGTFMSLPAEYRDYFVRSLHDALSGHTSANVAEAVRSLSLPSALSPASQSAQRVCLQSRLSGSAHALPTSAAHARCAQITYSEQSRTKCIGLTIETRPDYCHSPHLAAMLSYGCTRIEMGVQSIYEDVARDTNRGHTVDAVKRCFRLAKDAGFKVVAHMMPDLPNVAWERDIESFREFFENPDFRCALIRERVLSVTWFAPSTPLTRAG